MLKRDDAVRSTYDAYNARDLPRALANLSADVDWDDGEGNMLHGKDAVARHWADSGGRPTPRSRSSIWHGRARTCGSPFGSTSASPMAAAHGSRW